MITYSGVINSFRVEYRVKNNEREPYSRSLHGPHALLGSRFDREHWPAQYRSVLGAVHPGYERHWKIRMSRTQTDCALVVRIPTNSSTVLHSFRHLFLLRLNMAGKMARHAAR